MEQYELSYKKLGTLPNQWYSAGKTVQVISILGKYYPKNISELTQIITGKDKERFTIKVYKSGKNGVPQGAIDEYICDLRTRKQLGEINNVVQSQPQQSENFDKFNLLLDDSKNKIQQEANWKLEKFTLEQKLERLQEKYDTSKEKNTELVAQYAKLEAICDKFEQSAKDMENKASFTDVVKGLAGNIGSIVPMLMGGGGMPPTAQMMGIEQSQQQEPTYVDTLNQMFGDEAQRVNAILEMLIKNPKRIPEVRGWLDRNP